MKTCWKGLAKVEVIGRELLEKYAIRHRGGKSYKINRRRSLAPISRVRTTVGAKDLIYFTKSSDYCLPTPHWGHWVHLEGEEIFSMFLLTQMYYLPHL